MTSESNAASTEYQVTCHSCSTEFDALKSGWCSCIATMPTLVCPSCLSCFCQASKDWKSEFWTQAPDQLWERRFDRRNEKQRQTEDVAPEDMARPLVLVADDDRVFQNLTLTAVSVLGYSCLIANDGLEALQMAQNYLPDLVLTDALMPKMDGREVCRKLKEDPATQQIKVIVMTSIYRDSRYKSEAIGVFKADAFLTKPIDFNTLRNTLEGFLG